MNAPAGSFLDGVAEQLATFAATRGIQPEDVYIRFTLADHTHALSLGLTVFGPSGTYGWGMIEGLIDGSADAVAIREDHVLTVEFQVEPIVRTGVGLHAELLQP